MTELTATLSRFFRLPPEQIWARASAVLPPWVTGAMVVVIAWQAAGLAWSLVPVENELPPPQAVAAAAGPAAGQGAGMDVSGIVRAHLFGQYVEEEAEAAIEEFGGELEPTKLNLTLVATIAADDAERARAIIAEGSGNQATQKVLKLGDAIPGGASLHAIELERIILRRSGKLEELRLPRSEDGSGSQRTARAPARRPSQATSVRQVIEQNQASLSDIVRFMPVNQKGQQTGYRVYPGRMRQQFTRLGLRPGDLVTHVNGTALDDPSKGMELLREMGDATQVSVQVTRNGQPTTIELDMSDLDMSANGRNARFSTR